MAPPPATAPFLSPRGRALALAALVLAWLAFELTLLRGGGAAGGGGGGAARTRLVPSSSSLSARRDGGGSGASSAAGGDYAATARASSSSSASAPHGATPWRCPFPRRDVSCAARDRAARELLEGRVVMCLWDDNSGMHAEQLSQMNKPTHFEWDRTCDPARTVSLFALTSTTHLDRTAACCSNDTFKVFLATEPPAIQPQLYETMARVARDFDVVLSLGGPELFTAPNVVHWPWGSSWVPLAEWRVYPKTRLCSIIASNQRFAPGHKLRHEAVAALREAGFDCDVLGHGYRPVPTKRDGLADYMFSIVIENSISGSGAYMTEKIIDALAVGTVPVYWGNPAAPHLFGEGVIPWSSLAELKALLPSLTPQRYAALAPHIKSNVERAREFAPPERWLWRNVFECAYTWLAENPDSCVNS